jgi:hypothetical protein
MVLPSTMRRRIGMLSFDHHDFWFGSKDAMALATAMHHGDAVFGRDLGRREGCARQAVAERTAR